MEKKHISDELLAAFLEGNVSKEEMAQVLNAAATDSETNELLSIAMQLDKEEFPALQMAAEGGRNLCDVKCEAYVLNKLGIQTTVEELFEVAKEKRWLRRTGTPLFRIGNLLEYKGLYVFRKFDATIDDITMALSDGLGIIVAVDSDKLYPERPDEEDATNHAIVITDIDTDNNTITIFDPENTAPIEIKFPLFMSAWHESKCYLVTAKKKF